MSEYAVAEFFKQESLLSVSLGQDGLLGYFASNYSMVIAMYDAIYYQQCQTLERKEEAFDELNVLRDEKEHLDRIISSGRTLNRQHQGRYNKIPSLIEHLEGELEREDPVFFRGFPLKRCSQYEFIELVEEKFPGAMLAIREIDHMLRGPVGNWVSQALSWGLLPMKYIVGTIIEKGRLGVAGNMIYLLLEHYPEVIKQRIQAEVPAGKPTDYPDYKADGLEIKEIRKEVYTD
jgi:hypothetical protein